MTKGVVRSIDSLGRIVIPKEYRKTLGIHDLDRLELTISGDVIEIKKCNQEDPFMNQMNIYFKSLNNIFPNKVFFINKDNIYSYKKKTPDKISLEFREFDDIQYKKESITLFKKEYNGYFMIPLYEFSNFIGFIIIIEDYSKLSSIELIYEE